MCFFGYFLIFSLILTTILILLIICATTQKTLIHLFDDFQLTTNFVNLSNDLIEKSQQQIINNKKQPTIFLQTY